MLIFVGSMARLHLSVLICVVKVVLVFWLSVGEKSRRLKFCIDVTDVYLQSHNCICDPQIVMCRSHGACGRPLWFITINFSFQFCDFVFESFWRLMLLNHRFMAIIHLFSAVLSCGFLIWFN